MQNMALISRIEVKIKIFILKETIQLIDEFLV